MEFCVHNHLHLPVAHHTSSQALISSCFEQNTVGFLYGNKFMMIDETVDMSAALGVAFSFIAKATVIWSCSIAAYLVYRYLKWFFSPLWKQNIPGPKTNNFLVGEFVRIRREPFLQPHFQWINTITGWDVPMIHYSTMFGRHALLIMDSSIIKEILTASYGKEPLRFTKDVGNVRSVLGDGLVTLEGENWMRHRQIIQPAFFTQAIKDSLNTHVPRLTSEFVEHWKKAQGREINLSSHISSLTLDIIGKVAFSHQFRGLRSVKKWATEEGSDNALGEIDDPFVQALGAALKPNIISLLSIVLGIPAIGTYLNPRMQRVRREMNYHVDLVISSAKQQLEQENGKGNKSLLTLLLEAAQGESKRTLDNIELNDEIKTFIFAGHETTSTWCNMAIYAFTQHPRVQNLVYEDVIHHAPPSTALTHEVVEKMEYLNAFLQEVLRMYPPVGAIARYPRKTERIAGTIIPPGTRLMISPYLLHRHPKYWDHPNEFKPERWLEKSEDFAARIRFAFFPFSAGGRNCIGQRFATLEAKLIMAELVRSFVFHIAPSQAKTEFSISNLIVIKTKPSLKVVVKSRDKI